MGDSTVLTVFQDRVEVSAMELRVGDAPGIPLHVDPLVVGTHSDCDVVLSDPRVSRRHCRLSLGGRGVLVEDLSSKNGTFVGGVEVGRAWLTVNTPIVVGDTRLFVRELGGSVEVPLSPETHFGDAIGASIRMRALFAHLERAAKADVTVLLLGESGTGKELLAQGIHSTSTRRGAPFIPFDCGAVPPTLIESELFGYARGAFTGANTDRKGVLAAANGGTLFLDEIGELPLDLQPKLLRAIDAGQFRPVGGPAYESFDARVVAATHRPLRQYVANGTFRQDLFYRLAVVEVRVPPLRERRDDIELLVQRFLESQSPPRSVRDLPRGALAMLQAHDWPGNVRELKNAVARLLLFPESEPLDLPGAITGQPDGRLALPIHLPLRAAREQIVDAFERAYIVAKLKETSGNVSRTADAMNVSRQFLHRLMDRHGVRRTDAK
jgi:two-component system, NtrC family, response regulator GlrR